LLLLQARSFTSSHEREQLGPTPIALYEDDEILQTLRDLRAHDVEMLTIGQYLAPSGHHLPVLRYVHPDVFAMCTLAAEGLGFTNVACAPLVRSSYHADQQAHGAGVA